MNIKNYTHCPECGGKWLGDPIPYEDWERYKPPYFYTRLIEYCDYNPDDIAFYECPDCRLFFPAEYDPQITDIHVWNSILNTYANLVDTIRCGKDCGGPNRDEMLLELNKILKPHRYK